MLTEIFYICRCIGEILTACREYGYIFLVTADHGNAEKMYSETGGPHTAHTCNRGRFRLVIEVDLDL